MKICITAGAEGIDAPVDPRFGRCPFFVVVETDDANMQAESYPNNSAMDSSGAGIQAAQYVASLGISALVTGNMGPNAMQTLSAAGIDVYQHIGGSVRDVITQFKNGSLQKIVSPSVAPHSGMNRGGFQSGGGRGGGASSGRGRGRGGAGGGAGGGQGGRF